MTEKLPFIIPVLDSEGKSTGLICVYEGEEKGKALQKKRLEEAKKRAAFRELNEILGPLTEDD